MRQQADDPAVLLDLVKRVRYKGWQIKVEDIDRGQGSEGLTMIVHAVVQDTYRDRQIGILHYFPVPPAAYDERSWRRWVFDRLLELERHEAAEYFVVVDDGGVETRPYAPHHGPGNDPYIIFEHGTDEDVRTSFRGEVNP